MVLDFYKKTKAVLQTECRCVLLLVIDNEGSSPGRKGFKMCVSASKTHGTIGGGIMEHKLVEYARDLLSKPPFRPFAKQQIHDKKAGEDRSGMICSGRQTIAFYDVSIQNSFFIDDILSLKTDKIYFTDFGIQTFRDVSASFLWEYEETTEIPDKVYIVGGGHVGLALCEVLSRLDFEIHILDHRENLNTMQENTFARSRQTVGFEEIEKYIPEGDRVYVVIMSFGYRTDETALKRLLGRRYRYIGMMGSKEKTAVLFQKMISEGYDQALLSKIYAPIGLGIKSESAQEIAISVAAQLIETKNRG